MYKRQAVDYVDHAVVGQESHARLPGRTLRARVAAIALRAAFSLRAGRARLALRIDWVSLTARHSWSVYTCGTRRAVSTGIALRSFERGELLGREIREGERISFGACLLYTSRCV